MQFGNIQATRDSARQMTDRFASPINHLVSSHHLAKCESFTAARLGTVLATTEAGKQRARIDPEKEGTAMVANLVIVVRNDQPSREEHYPGTWLLYRRGQDVVEVHVAHDSHHKPYVLDGAVA
jgi:hypothetical protein